MISLMTKCIVALLFFSLSTHARADKRINVFVSILPQQYFVKRVGTEHVDINVMVGPGQSPETYEPTPQQMVRLATADIYFSIGIPFERIWLRQIKQHNKNLTIIECCQSLVASNARRHEKDEGFSDIHVWTDPINVIAIARLIEQSLSAMDRPNAPAYKDALHGFIQELEELDDTIKTDTAGLKKRQLIVSHPAWGHFAHRYGFTQIPIEQHGKEIQAAGMGKLIDLARQQDIQAIFIQPGFNNKAARIIATEIGADVFTLDPLAADYIENMSGIVKKIVRGLDRD